MEVLMKKIPGLIGLVCFIVSFNAWAGGGQASGSAASPGVGGYQWPRTITMLGASAGGNGVLSVGAIAQLVSKYAPTTAVAQVTAGATQNMYLMEDGEGTYCWAGAETINQAVTGRETFAGNPVKMQHMMVAEYSFSFFQVAVRKSSGIKTVQELKGKRVVVGAPGGGTESGIRVQMRAVGLYDAKTQSYLFTPEYSGVQEGCDMIANDQADAIIVGGTVPFSAYMELFLSDKIELVGFTEAEVKAINDATPSYVRAVIPAGSYNGKVPADLLTVASGAGLGCRPDVPEEEVYQIVKIMCEHWDELGVVHDMFTRITPEEICRIDTSLAPIHPGALRYYRERGWLN
jgi:TRAP transporter TAXI family solute receptor